MSSGPAQSRGGRERHRARRSVQQEQAAHEIPDLVDLSLVRSLQRNVAHRLTQERLHRTHDETGDLDGDDERQLTLELIRDEVSRYVQDQVAQGHEPPDVALDQRLIREIESAIFGAGSLQTLLDDPNVENIDINGDTVWITYGDDRGKVRGAPVAGSDEDLIDIIRTLGAYAGPNARPFSAATPELDLRLLGGHRLSALMSASERPAISIRRNRFEQIFLARIPPGSGPGPRRGHPPWEQPSVPTRSARTLVELGALDDHVAAFLEAAVVSRCNIVIAGATDAGKTTLLRALIHCVPAPERLVTVERALELGVGQHPHLHPDVVETEEVLPGPDGTGGLSVGALVARSRRMNPSRVIVGEVLGPEVVEMLEAMSQGNDGSLSTIHARSAGDVFDRLALYAVKGGKIDFTVTHTLIGAAVDLVVFVRKNPRLGGSRAVMEILEVTGSSDGRVNRSRIFAEGPDGRAARDWEVPIMRASALAEHGYRDTDWAQGVGTEGRHAGPASPAYWQRSDDASRWRA
jgi:pilus assembly protein CpaF